MGSDPGWPPGDSGSDPTGSDPGWPPSVAGAFSKGRRDTLGFGDPIGEFLDLGPWGAIIGALIVLFISRAIRDRRAA